MGTFIKILSVVGLVCGILYCFIISNLNIDFALLIKTIIAFAFFYGWGVIVSYYELITNVLQKQQSATKGEDNENN